MHTQVRTHTHIHMHTQPTRLAEALVLVLPDGRRYPVRGERFVIGSSPSCQLTLTWPGVVAEHAVILQRPEGSTLEQSSVGADVIEFLQARYHY